MDPNLDAGGATTACARLDGSSGSKRRYHASNVIDELLAVDPDAVGDLVFDTVRVLIVAPLGVEFEIDADDLQVRILSVWDANAGRPDPIGN